MCCPFKKPTFQDCLRCSLPRCYADEEIRQKQIKASAKWNKAHKDKHNAYNKKYRDAHREQINVAARTRRKQKRAASKAGTLEAAQNKTN